jgi:predicted glycosyltransferase
MEMMYAAADVVVARAGAITCSELLVTAKPAILVCKCGMTLPWMMGKMQSKFL